MRVISGTIFIKPEKRNKGKATLRLEGEFDVTGGEAGLAEGSLRQSGGNRFTKPPSFYIATTNFHIGENGGTITISPTLSSDYKLLNVEWEAGKNCAVNHMSFLIIGSND